jgi:hypothetical protein
VSTGGRIEDTEVFRIYGPAGFVKNIDRAAQSRALNNDRKWFQKHHWRRYRIRPAMRAEFPDELEATHTLVVRLSPNQHARFTWRLREGEMVPSTDREIAAMFGIETVI